MNKTLSFLKTDLLNITIWAIATLLGKTWRIKISSPQSIDPFNDCGERRMYCFWHSQLLALSYIFRATEKTALVSKSRDGRRAAAVAKMWKHDIVFGSSSRDGMSGLRQCLRVLGKKRCLVITPDGPRGPREIVKPGVAQIAMLSKADVIPVSFIPEHCWRLKSWDSFIIPKPFTKIKVLLGEPICGSPSTEDPIESLRALIQERMIDNHVKLAG